MFLEHSEVAIVEKGVGGAWPGPMGLELFKLLSRRKKLTLKNKHEFSKAHSKTVK